MYQEKLMGVIVAKEKGPRVLYEKWSSTPEPTHTYHTYVNYPSDDTYFLP